MKRFIAAAVAACLIMIIVSPSVQDALMLFVMAGIIPGTSLTVPPLVMLAGLLVALYFSVRLGHREASKISLPPLEEVAKQKSKKAGNRRGRAKSSLRSWRDALRPQLKLLQQKLVAFAIMCHGVAMQLLPKLRQVGLKTFAAVRFPIRAIRVAQNLRKVTSLVAKKQAR